jgi:hypothetical protein
MGAIVIVAAEELYLLIAGILGIAVVKTSLDTAKQLKHATSSDTGCWGPLQSCPPSSAESRSQAQSAPAKPRVTPIAAGQTKSRTGDPDRCPVCGRPMMGPRGPKPEYLDPTPQQPLGRRPIARETVLSSDKYSPKNCVSPHGERVYEDPEGRQYYVDRFHIGKKAQIEVFDPSGKEHLGEMCPYCGYLDETKKDPKKKLKC